MSYSKETLHKLSSEPLLQHGQLVAAEEIKKPFAIPTGTLATWLSFTQEACNTQGFLCLAFTELASHIREALGFSKDLLPRVIYYRTEMSEKGILVINPKISTNLNGKENPDIPIFEACGSIDNGRLWYFINRPAHRRMEGLIYNGDKLKKKTIVPNDPYNDLSLHEVDHLDGKTALSRPTDFCDIRNIEDWASIKKWYESYSEEELRRIIGEASPDGLLVFDQQEQKFALVNPHGEFLRWYK